MLIFCWKDLEEGASKAPAIVVFTLLESLVLIQAILSYRDHFLFPYQLAEIGVQIGLPFAGHLGMWSDLIIISPLASYVVLRFGRQWEMRNLAVSTVSALILSAFMSWSYGLATTPEAHTRNGELTAVGQVHLVYMTVALAIFTQLLFYTRPLRLGFMVMVSFFLTLHVFIGTHMALGLLNLLFPFPWYAGRPLRSAVGWVIIILVAFMLGWRTISVTNAFERLEAYIRSQSETRLARWIMKHVVRFVMVEDLKTIEDFFKFLDTGCKAIAFGFFSIAFGFIFVFRRSDAFPYFNMGLSPDIGWQEFESACLLILCGINYYASRHSVKTELRIARQIYAGRAPRVWGTPGKRVEVVGIVIAFMGGYFAVIILSSLGYFMPVYGIMLLIALIDYNGRRRIADGVSKSFKDPEYAVNPSSPDYQKVLRRRAIISNWLLLKRHLKKEGGRVLGFGVAFALAIYADTMDLDILRHVALLIFSITLIGNEYITYLWRLERQDSLDEAA